MRKFWDKVIHFRSVYSVKDGPQTCGHCMAFICILLKCVNLYFIHFTVYQHGVITYLDGVLGGNSISQWKGMPLPLCTGNTGHLVIKAHCSGMAAMGQQAIASCFPRTAVAWTMTLPVDGTSFATSLNTSYTGGIKATPLKHKWFIENNHLCFSYLLRCPNPPS